MRHSAQIFNYALYLFTALVAVAAVAVSLKFIHERNNLRMKREKTYACMLDAMKKVPGVHDAEMDYSKIKGNLHPIFKYNYPNEKGISVGRPPRQEFDIQTDDFIEKMLDHFQIHGQPAKKFDMEIDGFIDKSNLTRVQAGIVMSGLVSKQDNLPYYWGTTEVANAWKIKCGVSFTVLSE